MTSFIQSYSITPYLTSFMQAFNPRSELVLTIRCYAASLIGFNAKELHREGQANHSYTASQLFSALSPYLAFAVTSYFLGITLPKQAFILTCYVGIKYLYQYRASILSYREMATNHLVHNRVSFPKEVATTHLARISHQTLGKLGTPVPPNIPSNSFGNVYEHSLQELLEISKKQSVQSSSRAGEKYGLVPPLENQTQRTAEVVPFNREVRVNKNRELQSKKMSALHSSSSKQSDCSHELDKLYQDRKEFMIRLIERTPIEFISLYSYSDYMHYLCSIEWEIKLCHHSDRLEGFLDKLFSLKKCPPKLYCIKNQIIVYKTSLILEKLGKFAEAERLKTLLFPLEVFNFGAYYTFTQIGLDTSRTLILKRNPKEKMCREIHENLEKVKDGLYRDHSEKIKLLEKVITSIYLLIELGERDEAKQALREAKEVALSDLDTRDEKYAISMDAGICLLFVKIEVMVDWKPAYKMAKYIQDPKARYSALGLVLKEVINEASQKIVLEIFKEMEEAGIKAIESEFNADSFAPIEECFVTPICLPLQSIVASKRNFPLFRKRVFEFVSKIKDKSGDFFDDHLVSIFYILAHIGCGKYVEKLVMEEGFINGDRSTILNTQVRTLSLLAEVNQVRVLNGYIEANRYLKKIRELLAPYRVWRENCDIDRADLGPSFFALATLEALMGRGQRCRESVRHIARVDQKVWALSCALQNTMNQIRVAHAVSIIQKQVTHFPATLGSVIKKFLEQCSIIVVSEKSSNLFFNMINKKRFRINHI